MLKHIFKLLFHTYKKNSLFTFSGILLMGLGLNLCFLILIQLNIEQNFDKWNPKIQSLYLVKNLPNINHAESKTLPALHAHLDHLEINHCYVDVKYQTGKLIVKNKIISSDKILNVGTNFLKFFPFKIIKGNPSNVFEKQNGIIISSKIANRLFIKNQNPIDKQVYLNGKTYKITGVYLLPHYSSITPEIITNQITEFSLTHFKNKWNQFKHHLIVKKSPQQKVKQIKHSIDSIIANNTSDNNIKSKIVKHNKLKTPYQSQFIPLSKINFQDRNNHIFNQNREDKLKLRRRIILVILILIICLLSFLNYQITLIIKNKKRYFIKYILGSTRGNIFYLTLLNNSFYLISSFFFALLISEFFIKHLLIYQIRLNLDLYLQPI